MADPDDRDESLSRPVPDGSKTDERAAARRLAGGTLTFLFTDLEGSTRMWERDPTEAGAAVAAHERLLRRFVGGSGGEVVKGTGDGILAVFESANEALEAAVQIQLELQRAKGVAARVAIHTGEAELRDNDYYGVALNRCQRVMAAAHGGQILLTLATEEVLTRPLPAGVTLRDLGRHRLPDVAEAMHLFQVTHPDLRSDFPPLRGAGAFAHNLPVQLTSFVGREKESAEATGLLRETRLVTLVGVGGGGKSRLALRVASDLLTEFAGGVWLVELAFAEEAEMVPRLIAEALGTPEEPGRKLLESVSLRLQEAPALLVLDNCEHLLDASAGASSHLLHAAPRLRILATSRERLGVPGEAVYVVPPMSVPGESESVSPETALGYDAVMLFTERAALADARFRLTAENCADVGRICRAVDGIPLAIELAAGRVGTLSVRKIAALLSERLEILGGGRRTGERRHETMLATLDWSHDLLTEQERGILAQLSVFQGSLDLAQVEAVCRLDGVGELLGLVMALVDKSLVIRDPGTGRYRLLEPVRRYGWEKLVERGEHDAISRNHALVFAELMETESSEDQSTWLERLEQEHDNVRAALRWALDHGEGELALRIGAAAWRFWRLRGHLTEGRNWLEQALEASGDATPAVLAHALMGAGDLAVGQGDDVAARGHLEQALALADELGDDAGAAASLTRLAGLLHREGDLQGATRLFEDALVRARRADDPSRVGLILSSLALWSEDQGNSAEAERYAGEALEVSRETDDLYMTADALLAQGEISINRGDPERARRVLDEALQIARDAGFIEIISGATAYLGKLALWEDRTDDGERLLSEALAMFQKLDHPVGTAWVMRHLGRAALEQGDPERAEALLGGALRISLDQVRPDAPLILQALGELQARAGDAEDAAVLVGAAEAARRRMGLRLPAREAELAEEAATRIRDRIGNERFGELASQGASLTLEEAAAYLAG
ncbi:MAG: tetratricopeptide repeat protein [Actinomycetota bacterium]|nr:tetratricopeptide repeat protein [Actinomycetota bacterium]